MKRVMHEEEERKEGKALEAAPRRLEHLLRRRAAGERGHDGADGGDGGAVPIVGCLERGQQLAELVELCCRRHNWRCGCGPLAALLKMALSSGWRRVDCILEGDTSD